MAAHPLFASGITAAICLIAVSAGFMPLSAADAPKPAAVAVVEAGDAVDVATMSGVTGGLCLWLDGTGTREVDLVRNGRFLLHALQRDAATVVPLRIVMADNAVAPFVSVEAWSTWPTLPYEKNHVTLIVAESLPQLLADGLTLPEIVRVLAPLGKACLGGVQEGDRVKIETALKTAGIPTCEWKGGKQAYLVFQKPWPKEMGTWTATFQGPGGQLRSTDTYMGVPNQMQWMSDRPNKHVDGHPAATLVGGGRVFYVHSNQIYARDAASGTVLWRKPFNKPPSTTIITDDGNLLTADSVSPSYDRKVQLLSGATGEMIHEIDKVNGLCQYEDGIAVMGMWGKYASYDATTMKQICDLGTMKPEINKEMDAGRGNVPAHNMILYKGRLFVRTATELIAKDVKTGNELWRLNHDEKFGGNMYAMMFAYDDKVMLRIENREKAIGTVGGRGGVPLEKIYKAVVRFMAISAIDGSVVWTHDLPTLLAPSYRGQVYMVAGRVWYSRHEQPMPDPLVIPENPDENIREYGFYQFDPNTSVFDGLNPETGKLEKSITMPKQINFHCGFTTVSERYYTGNRPFYMVEWETGKLVGRFGAIRQPCDNVGHFAAQGLFMVRGYTGCGCIRTAMSGEAAFSATDEPSWDGLVVEPTHPLEKGSAALPKDESPAAGDWPMYRCDMSRTAAGAAKVPDDLALAWRYQKAKANGIVDSPISLDWNRSPLNTSSKVTQPVIANGRVFLSDLEDKTIVALDAKTGTVAWTKMLPAVAGCSPTIANGLALVGCHDGWAYALRADTGEEVYRLRIAPAEGRMVAYGRLESTWPVQCGVMVVGDLAYALAGRSTEVDGGLHVVAFDVRSGRVAWVGRRYINNPGDVGPADERGIKEGAGSWDILTCDGSKVVIGSRSGDSRMLFDAATGEPGGKYSVRWYSLISASATTCIVDGTTFLSLFADREKKKPGSVAKNKGWSIKLDPGSAAALAGGGDRLVAAVANQTDGELLVLAPADGTKLASVPLPVPPTEDGLAVADGMVLVALTDGSVVCYGKP